MLFWKNSFKFVKLCSFWKFYAFSNNFKPIQTSSKCLSPRIEPSTFHILHKRCATTPTKRCVKEVFPYANIKTLLFGFTFDFSSLIYILIPVFCVCLQDFGASSFCSIIRFLNLFFSKVFITVKIFGGCMECFYMLFWRNFFKFVKYSWTHVIRTPIIRILT